MVDIEGPITLRSGMKILSMDDAKAKFDLLIEALEDYKVGALSELSTLVVIDSLLSPVEITKADMDWAKKELGIDSPKQHLRVVK